MDSEAPKNILDAVAVDYDCHALRFFGNAVQRMVVQIALKESLIKSG